jgi:sugar lactone lactonase YvrE
LILLYVNPRFISRLLGGAIVGLALSKIADATIPMKGSVHSMRMRSRRLTVSVAVVAALAALLVAGCADSSTSTNSTPTTGGPSAGKVTGLPGYQVSVFAQGTASYFGPDSLVDDGTHIFVDYQNKTAKDCTDAATANSTVVEYSLEGKVVKQFTVPGHSDGMREDPGSHLLWVTSCEDGNPRLVTIDPSSGTITPYTFPPTPHGGGYDDLAFLNGTTYIAASNPNTNAAGVNVFPAVDSVTLSGGNAVLTPVLMGNANAKDLTTNQTVQLNEIDPDSMTVDPQGNLVLVNQGGSEIVFISHPGAASQAVSRLPVGDQLDDTVWATRASGRLLVADGVTNTIYWIRYQFKPYSVSGFLYTEAPDDSGVVGFVGTIDPGTGLITPVVIGLVHPTGMIFVPDA